MRTARLLPWIVAMAATLCAPGCERRATVSNPASRPARAAIATFAQLRAAHPTKLLVHGPSPEPVEPFNVPDDAKLILYPSGSLELLAWVSRPPADGVRHPAVVYLHGNFCFEPRHWDAAKPYRDAGFVTMTPMLRGENGNQGDFQLFYGEVDDVVAAADYLASLDYVDPDHIYLCGHSVGGTLAMLASMLPSRYRAVAALSGAPDFEKWLRAGNEQHRVFDRTDPWESRLRTPRLFVADIRCPLFLMDGDRESFFISDTSHMADNARSLGKRCTFQTFPGDHRGYKMEAIRKTVEIFRNER